MFVVADGMGGYHGGELASRIAVGAIDGYFQIFSRGDALPDQEQMGQAFRVANREVRRLRKGEFSQMGSTLSALLIRGDRAMIGHVGDSRVYRLREGRLEQLTCDHSLVSAMREAGVCNGLIQSRYGHVVTRAIGVTEDSEPDVTVEDVEVGDRFLLCTDGLTDVVDDETLAGHLAQLPPAEAATALVEEALRRGGEDNITAVVVDIRPPRPEQREKPFASYSSAAR